MASPARVGDSIRYTDHFPANVTEVETPARVRWRRRDDNRFDRLKRDGTVDPSWDARYGLELRAEFAPLIVTAVREES